jgi:hypothetical protein
MPTATKHPETKKEPPVRFLGFSGPLMIFSDSKLLIQNNNQSEPKKATRSTR